jgi:triacylglycerol lipase
MRCWKKCIVLMMLVAAAISTDASSPPAEREVVVVVVVVLHGLGRTRLSMNLLATRLRNHGFAVVNLGYPSRRYGIAELTEHLDQELSRHDLASARRVHFLTHSLGGIIVRNYLEQHSLPNLGRVVMLSPPNQGSEVVDRLRDTFFYRLATGPAGQELGTDALSIPSGLGPVKFPLGIIAGTRSLNPLFSSWITGENDGTVSVQRCRAEGMTDFLVVRHSHSFIMRSSLVAEQVVEFIRHGRFSHPSK